MKWRFHAPTPMLSDTTATAGGLVFTADLLGNLHAFDAANGSKLATVALTLSGAPLAAGGGLVSYAVAGKQYVAVAAGFSAHGLRTPNVDATLVVLAL